MINLQMKEGYRYEKKTKDLLDNNKLSRQREKLLRDRSQSFLLSLYMVFKYLFIRTNQIWSVGFSGCLEIPITRSLVQTSI